MSEDTPPSRATLGIAAALVILKTRRYRRNLLFGLTAFTLFLVAGGIIFLGDELMEKRPGGFIIFWLIVFLMVMVVLTLALYDFMQIRREGRKALRSLEERLAEAQSEVLGDNESDSDSNRDASS